MGFNNDKDVYVFQIQPPQDANSTFSFDSFMP